MRSVAKARSCSRRRLAKTLIGVLCAAVLLTACETSEGVTTSGREMDEAGKLGADVKIIQRSYGSVVQGLRAGAKTCLNRVVSANDDGTGPWARYSTGIGEAGEVTVLRLRHEIGSVAGNYGAREDIYTVQVRPGGKGTVVELFGGDATFRSLDVGVLRFANGDSIICPRMPVEY